MAAVVAAAGIAALGLMWLMAGEDARDAIACAIGAALVVALVLFAISCLPADTPTGYEGSAWEALPVPPKD